MAGAGLLEIKRRIKSIKNTRKITKAMGLVATSKLRKARQKLTENNQYFSSLDEIARELIGSLNSNNNPLLKPNDNPKKLIILLASDSGLCGGFNGNTAAFVRDNYENNLENIEAVVVGKKGIHYVKKNKISTLAEYVDLGDTPNVGDASTIVNKAVKEFTDGNFGEVSLVYTKFFSPVKQEVVEEKLLPLDLTGEKGKVSFLIEPDEDEIIDSLVSSYLKGKFMNAMFNSKASEQSARMQAMDGATKNADNLLNSLDAKYNRIRQSIITQEISEIVGGAEAQK